MFLKLDNIQRQLFCIASQNTKYQIICVIIQNQEKAKSTIFGYKIIVQTSIMNCENIYQLKASTITKIFC